MAAKMPIAEDFDAIRAGVARLESERRRMLQGGCTVSAQQAAEFEDILSAGKPEAIAEKAVGFLNGFYADAGITGRHWKVQSDFLLASVISALAWLRDDGLLALSAIEVHFMLRIDQLIYMAGERTLTDIPQSMKMSLQIYLDTLPGFRMELGSSQPAAALEKHAFVESRLLPILKALGEV